MKSKQKKLRMSGPDVAKLKAGCDHRNYPYIKLLESELATLKAQGKEYCLSCVGNANKLASAIQAVGVLRDSLAIYADESNWGNGGLYGEFNTMFRPSKVGVLRGSDVAKSALEKIKEHS